MTASHHTEPAGIQTILFDLDDTLVTYGQDSEEILQRVFDRTGIPQFCTFEDLRRLAVVVPDRPSRSHEEVWVSRFRRAAELNEIDPSVAPILYQAYGRVLDRTDVSFRSGARQILRRVPEQVSTGIVTNGKRSVQEEKLSSLQLTETFQAVVCADDVAKPKPASNPFEAALSVLDTAPEDALYIGDDPVYDVTGARRAGLHVVWWPHPERVYPNGPANGPEYSVRSTEELASVLESLLPPDSGAP